MRVEPIQDYVVLVVPPDAKLDEQTIDRLTAQAQVQIFAQYRTRPRALVIEPIDWLITSDPAEVERHQPDHDCAACRAGNDQARAYLTEHPDGRLALGNLRYTEVWT